MQSIIIERAKKGTFTLIAEIGVNYYDIAAQRGITPIAAACLMVDHALASGAHAVKFQTYKAQTLAAKASPSYWDLSEEPTCSQFELFKKFDSFNEQEYAQIAKHCMDMGIEFLSTPFDFESADYLDKYMAVYKISSSDLTNIPFIKHIAGKGKPILLSVGASNVDEIDATVRTIRKINQQPLVLLHCVLEYPTPVTHVNLNRIVSLKERYDGAFIGYSDHSVPDATKDVIKAAYLLGARVIEKHFTLDKTLKGNDHYHAMDVADAKDILNKISHIEALCGNGDLVVLETEAAARRNARRSVVSTREISAGQVITTEMLTCKRPGTGIPPGEQDRLVGMKAKININEDTLLQWDMFN
ncbi:MAG: N-acetylneuraminate synthase family protein [Defluviitaleaceae bacterium]|nr:N-acetylneuraminate synthase family protein [Defluviitaleaceae bacterium]MCL2238352.1 N-acetylneuraminate synthase family protein [Defluviitaleaceae bacterium]